MTYTAEADPLLALAPAPLPGSIEFESTPAPADQKVHAGIRPVELEQRREMMPGFPELVYLSTPEVNREVLGDDAYENTLEQIRSVRRRAASDVIISAVSAHKTYQDLVAENDAKGTRLGIPEKTFNERAIAYATTNQKSEAIKEAKRAGASPEDVRQMTLDRWQYNYDNGLCTLVELRLALLEPSIGNKLRDRISSITQGYVEEVSASRAQNPNELARTKAAITPVMQERLADIVLAAPRDVDPQSLNDFVGTKADQLAHIAMGETVANDITAVSDPDAAKQMANENLNVLLYPGYKLEYVVGLGGSETAPTIRLGAYLTPALERIKRFKEVGATNQPSLRVLLARNMSQTVNNLDPLTTEKRGLQTERYVKGFVQTFYPGEVDHVELDVPTIDEIRSPEYDDDVRWLTDELVHAGDTVTDIDKEGAAAHKKLRKAVGNLGKRALKHADGDDPEEAVHKALAYAGGHGVPEAFGDYRRTNGKHRPHGTIKFGGAGETDFNIIQSAVAARHTTGSIDSDTYLPNTAARSDGKPQPIHVVMRAGGDPPPYYATAGDLTLDTALLPHTMDAAKRHYAAAAPDDIEAQRDLSRFPAGFDVDAYVEWFHNLAQSERPNRPALGKAIGRSALDDESSTYPILRR